MRKAYLYQRFSTSKQERGGSIDRQTEAQEDWLSLEKNKDVKVQGKIIVDKALSGTGAHIEKGSLGLLLASIEAGLIEEGSLIIVERFNRLSRMTISKTEQFLYKIWDKKITIVTVSNGNEYPPEVADKLHVRMELLFQIHSAFEDSDFKSKKALSTSKRRREAAKDDGKAPKLPSMPFWLDKNGKLNGKDKIIKEIFKLYKEGYGQQKIREKIRLKFDEDEAQNMNSTSVLRWIKSDTVRGYWITKGEPTEDPKDRVIEQYKVFDAAIDDDLFYEVQGHYKARSEKRKRPNPDRNWTLSGLCKCGYCGSTMSIANVKHSPPIMRCVKRQRLGKEGCECSPTFPYIIARYFYDQVVKNDLVRALSTQILNKNESIEYSKLEQEILNLKDKKSRQKSRYDKEQNPDKQEFMLDLLLETESDIKKKSRRILQIEENLKERTYIADEIDDIKKDPVKLNILFNLLDMRMVIKDKVISWDNGIDKIRTIEYLGYKYKEDGFAISLNYLNIEDMDFSKFEYASESKFEKLKSVSKKELKVITNDIVKKIISRKEVIALSS